MRMLSRLCEKSLEQFSVEWNTVGIVRKPLFEVNGNGRQQQYVVSVSLLPAWNISEEGEEEQTIEKYDFVRVDESKDC